MKYLDLFLKQYRISLSHQKGIEVSGIILFLKLMTLRIYKDFPGFSMQDFYSALSAFGWSISIPDISQSNSRQERFRTSDCFLGH